MLKKIYFLLNIFVPRIKEGPLSALSFSFLYNIRQFRSMFINKSCSSSLRNGIQVDFHLTKTVARVPQNIIYRYILQEEQKTKALNMQK